MARPGGYSGESWRREGHFRAAAVLPGEAIRLSGGALHAYRRASAARAAVGLKRGENCAGSRAARAMEPPALALTMGIARLVGQGVAGRIDPFALWRTGAAVAAIYALIASQAGGAGLAHAGFIIMGTGVSVIAPTAFSLVGRFGPTEARAVARATPLGYCGYFLGPPLLGLIFVLAPMMARQRA